MLVETIMECKMPISDSYLHTWHKFYKYLSVSIQKQWKRTCKAKKTTTKKQQKNTHTHTNKQKQTTTKQYLTRAGVCKTLCPQLPDSNTA